MLKIKETFDERFQRWQIQLPLENLEGRHSGSIRQNGWLINYRFGRDGEQECLGYFASHRMTNDTLNRIWEDGRHEVVGYCQEFYLANSAEAEQAYREHNRHFYRQVKEWGLE